MTSKQRLLSLLAASSLAAWVHGCGASEANEPAEPEPQNDVGGEAEAACGGGACGAATTDEESS